MWTLDEIPDDLRDLDRFVVWKRERVNGNGRETKIPYVAIAPFEKASSTDPTTWGTFDAARACYEDGKCDGPGFVLGGGFIGIDIDSCIQDGIVDEQALRIMEAIASYAEVSPSGTGIHILCRGSLPPGRRRIGPYEMYDTGRYFTITGAHLCQSPRSVNEATEALHRVH